MSEEDEAELLKIRKQQANQRRPNVCGSTGVTTADISAYCKPVYMKSLDTQEALKQLIWHNENMQVLVGHLNYEQLMDVVNAFYERSFPEGSDIIIQGDVGERLYLIADGNVDVYVARRGRDGSQPEGRGPRVTTLGPGMLFGELALMYNAPRAATVTAPTPVTVWVLDARDFQMLLKCSGQAQFVKYEGWLADVELFKALNNYELSKLANVVVSECFEMGEDIIRQGELGESIYILEDGSCSAFIANECGDEIEVRRYTVPGEYFGELATLHEVPRKATVRATGSGCRVVSLSKTGLESTVGPLANILEERAYPTFAEVSLELRAAESAAAAGPPPPPPPPSPPEVPGY